MEKLYFPDNETDLAIIKSLFEAGDINYFVLNDHFGSLQIGLPIELYNAKAIYVHEEDFEPAKEILLDYLANTRPEKEPTMSPYSLADKLRMIIEALMFTWFIPGSRWNKKKLSEG